MHNRLRKNRLFKRVRFLVFMASVLITLDFFQYAMAQVPVAEQRMSIEQLQYLAEQGDALYQYELGMRYFHGQGVQSDYVLARTWLEKSARQHFPKALSMVGTMYQTGVGGREDKNLAIALYEKAASLGDIGAKTSLGLAYLEGDNIEKDLMKAFNLLKEAADAGDWAAQFMLGTMYAEGRGIPQDYVEAHKWFNILAAIGFEQVAEVRDRLAKKMTPDQIAKAQQLAREWKTNRESEFSRLLDVVAQSILDEETLRIQAQYPYVAKIDNLPPKIRDKVWTQITEEALVSLVQKGINTADGNLNSRLAFITEKATLAEKYWQQYIRYNEPNITENLSEFDWGNIVSKGIASGLGGGIIAFFFGVASLFFGLLRRNKTLK